MSYQLTAWAVKQRTGSVTKKAILLALANCASHQTNRCEPLVAEIAEEVEVNERTVRRALDDLEEAGFISREMKHNANGYRAGYVYSFPHLLPDNVSARPEPPTGLSVQRLPDTVSGQDLEVQEGQEQKELNPPTPLQDHSHVVNTWLRSAPPLIAHRLSILSEQVTVRAVRRAIERYGVDDVVAAVENYAAVLGGDEFRWSHRWTLIEFLKRGLDRFVPEAQPLDNFRISGEKFGRRDVSGTEMTKLADRLRDERRSLESG